MGALDSLSLILIALTGIRFLGMLLSVNLYISKRETKYLVLISGWLIGAIGSAWGLYTHVVLGEMASFSFSLLAGFSTFWLGCGALLYFNAITLRAIVIGSVLILAYSFLPLAHVLALPLPGVLAQVAISLVVTFAVLFRRKSIWKLARSSYFWLVAMALLSVALTTAFGLGVFAGDTMALGFVGTSLVTIIAIIYFLHLEHCMSTRQVVESKERYKSLFDFAPVALWEEDASAVLKEFDTLRQRGITDLRAYIAENPDFLASMLSKLKVTNINQRAVDLQGSDSRGKLINSFETMFLPETWDSFREELIAIFENNQEFETETVLQTFSGERRYVILRLHSLLSEEVGASRLLVSFSDITNRKQAEQAQLELLAQLQQTQKLESIGTLASGVAHEINNPLMGMINYAELISDEEDETIKERAQSIIKEGNRIAKIVRNLLSFARQDREEHSPAALADIIDSSLSLVGSVLRKDQITIELNIPDDLPTVKCRSQQIEQVLINLLTNARDALNVRYPDYDENKLVRITVRPFEKDGDEWIRTTVEDHGDGVSEEKSERIFDPFFTTKARHEGTGLGLSVSFGIVREHHGELTVESVPNEYTRFHIDLRVNTGWALRNQEAGR